MKISDGGKLNLTKRTMVVAALAAGLIVAGAIAIVKPHASSTYVAQLTGTHKTPQAPKLPDSGVSSTPHGPLDLKGSGAEDTKQFTAGADWDLDWSYDCSKVQGQGVGRFAVSVFDSQGRVSTSEPRVAGSSITTRPARISLKSGHNARGMS